MTLGQNERQDLRQKLHWGERKTPFKTKWLFVTFCDWLRDSEKESINDKMTLGQKEGHDLRQNDIALGRMKDMIQDKLHWDRKKDTI